MRKTLAVILFFFYLIASTGVIVNFHYCCGHLNNVDLAFAAPVSESFPDCQMLPVSNNKNCCRDVHKLVKNVQSQNVVSNIVFPEISFFVIDLNWLLKSPALYTLKIPKGDAAAHAPPLRSTLPVYLRNEIFLI